ncbi:unnamed protein product [Victoria cruziana]
MRRYALFCFLLLLFTSTAYAFPPILGIDSIFSNQLLRDPNAVNDSFPSLPSSLRQSLSSTSFSHLHDYLSFLSDLTVAVHVDLTLVGFPPSVSNDHLSRFLSAVHDDDEFSVIASSFMPETHRLAVKHRLQVGFVPATSPLLEVAIQDAIRRSIDSSTSRMRFPSALHAVPFQVVDRIIGEDFAKRKQKLGYTIYLLNLRPSSKPYAYTSNQNDDSLAFSRCLGTVWMANERYMWVDLAAGPVNYGPSISGDGLIAPGEFHPLAALHGRPKSEKDFFADVASLIWSAYRALLVPSLRVPVFFEENLIVRFVHVFESETKDPRGLDFQTIEKTFADEARTGCLLLGRQKLKFEKYELKLSSCAICSFAVSKAMNSYTSRFLFENYTLIVNEYLDSKGLHDIMLRSGEEMKRSAGVPPVDEELGRIVPVYVFDLEFDKLLLLDRYHQAVAFKDMVIAVRTRGSQSVSDYSCNGRHVIVQARELERAIVGSILQSMWGVSPTHVTWSPRHNNTLIDYTWSIGQTPFGPFSELVSLSFVQKDAARRNVILTTLNYTITSAIDVIDAVARYGGEKKLLKKNHFVEFVQRWNVLQYKLERTMSAISHLDFETALFFTKASDHDLYAIHTLVYQASQELEASLDCFKDPPFPWVSASSSILIFSALLYAYLRRDTVFKSKRKQF